MGSFTPNPALLAVACARHLLLFVSMAPEYAPPGRTAPVYSVVTPVFNGAGALPELAARVAAVFTELDTTWELLLVDDGSGDGSWSVIRELSQAYPGQVRGLRLTRNFGQHNATLCGLRQARGQWLFTLDDDLQHPPEEIPHFLTAQAETGAELVYGSFRHRRHSLGRRLSSRLAQKVFQRRFGAAGEVTSFRLIYWRVVERLAHYYQPRFLLDGLLHWHTGDVVHIPVHHALRERGSRSRYSLLRLLRHAFDLALGYTTLPLRLMVWFGLLFALVSFGFGVYFFARRIVYNVPVGFSALIVSIFFSTSIILFVLGLIGEYLSRLYSSQDQHPIYVLGEEAEVELPETA